MDVTAEMTVDEYWRRLMTEGLVAFAVLLNRFYAAAKRVLLKHDAVIDKMVGDEVMALFLPGFCSAAYQERSADTARAPVDSVGYDGREEPWQPMGAGVHADVAHVGKVRRGGIVDFAAPGDTVNEEDERKET